MAKVTKDDVLSYLENANMLEISDLISEIDELISGGPQNLIFRAVGNRFTRFTR